MTSRINYYGLPFVPGVTDLGPARARTAVTARAASSVLAPRSRRASVAALRPTLAREILPRATYLTARAIDGRPVDGVDLTRLNRADRTVQLTRDLLYMGRGNVNTDIQETDHESSRRSRIAIWLLQRIVNPDGQQTVVEQAVAALLAKAGVCDDFTTLALCLYGHAQCHEDDGEISHVSQSDEPAHTWLVARPMRSQEGDEKSLVVDGWADGPAVFLEDATEMHRQGRGLQPLPPEGVRMRQARFHRYLTHPFTQTMAQAMVPSALKTLQEKGMTWAQEGGLVHDPMHVLSPEFGTRVQQSMGNAGLTAEKLKRRAAQYGAVTQAPIWAVFMSLALDACKFFRSGLAPMGPRLERPPHDDYRTALDEHGNSLRDTLAAVHVTRTLADVDVRTAVDQAKAVLDHVRQLPQV